MKNINVVLVGVIISLAIFTSNAFAIPTSTNKTVQTTGGRAALGTPAPKSEPVVKQAPAEAPAPKAIVEPPKAVVTEEAVVASKSNKGPSCVRAQLGGEMRWGGIHKGEAHAWDEGFGGKLDVDVGCRIGMFQPGGALQLGSDPFRLLGTSRDYDLSQNVGYAQVLAQSRLYVTKGTYFVGGGGLAFNTGDNKLPAAEFVAKLGSRMDVNSWLNDITEINFIGVRQVSLKNNVQFDFGVLYLGAINQNRFDYENKALAPIHFELGGEVGKKFDFGLDAHVGSLYSPTDDSFAVLVGASWSIPVED